MKRRRESLVTHATSIPSGETCPNAPDSVCINAKPWNGANVPAPGLPTAGNPRDPVRLALADFGDPANLAPGLWRGGRGTPLLVSFEPGVQATLPRIGPGSGAIPPEREWTHPIPRREPIIEPTLTPDPKVPIPEPSSIVLLTTGLVGPIARSHLRRNLTRRPRPATAPPRGHVLIDPSNDHGFGVFTTAADVSQVGRCFSSH